MNSSFLSPNRKKLILAIFLSLGLTVVSGPLIGRDTPQTPDIASVMSKVKSATGSLHLELPRFDSLPLLSLNKPTPPADGAMDLPIPTLIPTNPYVFRPTAVPSTAAPTITPVHLQSGRQDLPFNLPTQPDDNDPEDPYLYPSQPAATDMPSRAPRPTRVPRPTKTPTPEPLKLTNPRPGKNFADAAEIVGEAICIPPAMIRATLEIEYGPWMGDVEANWTRRNTYNGSDPHDNSGSTVIPRVAVMQMMEDTWYRIKPILAQKFGTSDMSLEVTFDSMLAGAYHLRNISLAMQDHVNCNDWPVKYILYGACRYNGACAAGSHTYNDYSYTVCNNYNKYTDGPKKNCQ